MGERTIKLHTLSCYDLEWKMSADNNDLPHLGEIVTATDVRKLIKIFLDYGKEVRFTKCRRVPMGNSQRDGASLYTTN